MSTRMAAALDAKELYRLARIGAAERLTQLERERAVLLRAFPGLKQGERTAPDAAASEVKSSSRRRRMSAEARKAVSLRMKKYWAERRRKG